MDGSAQFVRVPRALVVTAKNGANLGACSTQDINCNVFAKAGESFDLDIRGVTWQSDNDSDFLTILSHKIISIRISCLITH